MENDGLRMRWRSFQARGRRNLVVTGVWVAVVVAVVAAAGEVRFVAVEGTGAIERGAGIW